MIAVPPSKALGLGLGTIMGYLAAGIAIGPWGLGFVTKVQDILHLAEFGMVLMLFLVGLELEPKQRWRLRRPIFGTVQHGDCLADAQRTSFDAYTKQPGRAVSSSVSGRYGHSHPGSAALSGRYFYNGPVLTPLDTTDMITSLRVAALTLSLLATSLTFAQDALSAASAKEAGAVVTASGLVYRSLKDGAGTSPSASDKVKVHYRGTFADGKEFDSSYKRSAPIEFPLTGVIPCWTEGVQRMKVGGKAKLTCPAAIAYGSRGAGGVIPPNTTLLFEVELLGINGK